MKEEACVFARFKTRLALSGGQVDPAGSEAFEKEKDCPGAQDKEVPYQGGDDDQAHSQRD